MKDDEAMILTQIWAVDAPANHTEQEEQIADEVSMVSRTCQQHYDTHANYDRHANSKSSFMASHLCCLFVKKANQVKTWIAFFTNKQHEWVSQQVQRPTRHILTGRLRDETLQATDCVAASDIHTHTTNRKYIENAKYTKQLTKIHIKRPS